MSTTHEGRSISPDSTRNIWQSLLDLKSRKQPATLDNVLQTLSPMYDWNQDAMKSKLYQAIESGLLKESTGPNKKTVYVVPSPPKGQSLDDAHDWYCNLCHSIGEGEMMGCIGCHRIYHPPCLGVSEIDVETFMCPICGNMNNVSALDEETLKTELASILKMIEDKASQFAKTPDLGTGFEEAHCRLLAPRHITLAEMHAKLDRGDYGMPRQLWADWQLIYHNVHLFYPKNGDEVKTAKDLNTEIDSKMKTLEVEQKTQQGGAQRDPQKRPAARTLGGAGGGLVPKRPRRSGMADTAMKIAQHENGASLVMDDRLKATLIDLQRHWLTEYQTCREKTLVDMTEKLHHEFLTDQQKIRTELLSQFKDELDATRMELEQKYRETLRTDLAKMAERQRKEVSSIKKKQWCWQCEHEAIYHCCWNTAYCSVECQQAHWPTHRKFCRRKKTSGGAAGPGVSASQGAEAKIEAVSRKDVDV